MAPDAAPTPPPSRPWLRAAAQVAFFAVTYAPAWLLGAAWEAVRRAWRDGREDVRLVINRHRGA